MGLLQVAKDSLNTLLADQYQEYFYCDSIEKNVLMVKGQRRSTKNNNNGSDNLISNGSIIAVNEGQCMIIVEQGQIVEFCADPGAFRFDNSTESSIFRGKFTENIVNSFKTFGKRFAFAGETATDQRVYFFNTKEMLNNYFGTQNPIPFRVVDKNIGLDVDIAIRCNGNYSFKLSDPILFYKNVAGNIQDSYGIEELTKKMKSELLTALMPAFAEISAMGIRYSEVPAHSEKLSQILNKELSPTWGELRGIEIVTMSINSMTASEEDEQMIKDLQKTAVFRNAGMAAAQLTTAQAEAMKMAASNTSTGPMMAFAGMNMASQAGGMNASQLFQLDAQNQAMAQQQAAQQQAAPQAPVNPNMAGGNMGAMAGGTEGAAAPVLGWTCSCGQADNRGKFCTNCGSGKPSAAGWTCSCGAVNQGKFCMECGSKKPEGAPLYKCDKCGWEPEDPTNPPKFCPECGDVFDDNDKQ